MIPKMYQVKSVTQETADTFTLTLCTKNNPAPPFLPGQFNMLYLYGYGEAAISISGNPSQKDEIMHTVRAVGDVTNAMQRLKDGDEIGVRGPFGTSWPLTKTGCDILVIAGGLGLPPLRPLLHTLIAQQEQYKKITLLYGARAPSDIVYKNELQEWKKQGIDVQISVDRSDETWKGHVGVVTAMIYSHLTSPDNTRVFMCGPEIMMKFALHELMRKPIDPREIFLSMERNMHCALGFCGHCLYGPYFICKNGPIFSYDQVKFWLPIKEL